MPDVSHIYFFLLCSLSVQMMYIKYCNILLDEHKVGQGHETSCPRPGPHDHVDINIYDICRFTVWIYSNIIYIICILHIDILYDPPSPQIRPSATDAFSKASNQLECSAWCQTMG